MSALRLIAADKRDGGIAGVLPADGVAAQQAAVKLQQHTCSKPASLPIAGLI